MAKINKSSKDDSFLTPIALIMASIGGACIFFYAESTLDDMRAVDAHNFISLPDWQVDMGSATVAMAAFLLMFFLFEALAKKSKILAWRSTYPWLPLLGLTLLATGIHIQAYAIIAAGGIYSVWAYHRTRYVL